MKRAIWHGMLLGTAVLCFAAVANAQQQVIVAPTQVQILPVTANPITAVVSAAAESGHVIKASGCSAAAPCYLQDGYVVAGATAGFAMLLNAAAVPADGAVAASTLVDCIPVAAGTVSSLTYDSGIPESFSTGITVVFSSTGCFTITKINAAFIHARNR